MPHQDHERPGAEDAGRQTLQALLQAVPDSVLIVDAAGFVVETNEEGARRLGTTADSLIGASLLDFLPPDTARSRRYQIREVVRNRRPMRFTEWGVGRCSSHSFAPVVDAGGDVVRVAMVCTDITECSVAQERSHLQTMMLEAVGQALVAMDVDGNVIYWNHAAEQLYGWRREDVLGGNLPNTPLEMREHADEIRAALLRGGTWTGEFLMERRDGSHVPVWVTDSPAFDGEGNLIAVIRVGADVGERERAADEIRRLNAELACRVVTRTAELEDAIRKLDEETAGRELAETVAYESEERYRHLVDLSPEMIAVHQDGKWVYMNAAGAALLGSETPEQLLGRPIMEVVPPDFVEGQVWAATEEGRVTPFIERRLVRGDGTEVTVEGAGVPTTYEGHPAVLLVVRDITERKQVEDALRESEGRFRRLAENAPDIIFRLRLLPTRGFEYMSPAVVRVSGYAPEDFYADPEIHFRRVHPEDRPYLEALREGTVPMDRPFSLRWLRKDGTVIYAEHHMTPIRDEAGMVVAVEGIIRDVTQREQAINARRQADEARQKLLAIIEASPQLIVTADDAGYLLTVNGAGRLMLGLSETEEIPRLRFVDVCAPGACDLLLGEALPTAEREGIWSGESAVLSPGGQEIPLLLTVLAYPRGDDGVSLYAYIGSDVSEYKRVEEELRQSQKMEAVGRLAGGIAHDFNNLLMPILTYAQLLQDRLPAEDPLHRYSEQVVKAANRAAALPRQLLAFSRRQVLEPQVVDLNALVADMEKMLGRMIGEDVQLVTALPAGLGMVKVDPGQMEQVILNLVVNARDAMPLGGALTIETTNAELDEMYARRHPGARPGCYVALVVSDTGCGMDKETQSRIFEPFYTTKAEGKGTGLGLSTVYGIVKQSGGYIRVYSEVGIGTSFTVYLPRVDEAASAGEQQPDDAAAGGAETILLVEDNEVARETAHEILELLGYTVLVAADGDAALTVAAAHAGKIHLLLSDVVMPGMSGPALAEQMAHIHPACRTLYMSGYTDDAIVQHGVLPADAALIRKPFTHDLLARKVREILDA